MHSPGRIASYNAYTDTLIFVTVRNISQVDFELYQLPSADFMQLVGTNWWDYWDSYRPDEADLLADWTLETTPELDDNVIYRVDLAARSGLGQETLPPGLYSLEANYPDEAVYEPAQSPDYHNFPQRQILVVSQNNLTFKTSGSEALAWVTD
jgi:hypothetical protein